jgi:hypothetical protein
MAGVEALGALGALAAISQLVGHIFKITGCISKFRDAPKSIREQSAQVEHLVDITKVIEQNPSHQTTTVESILRDCIGDAEKLQEILRRISLDAGDGKVKKVWKTYDRVTKEKEILALFKKLEQRKTSLMLCIEATSS